MRILALHELEREGVPLQAIRVPVDDRTDEHDLVFSLDGVVICELKDQHFQHGHAVKFGGRILPMDFGVTALVVSSDTIAPDARDYLEKVIEQTGSSVLLAPRGRKQVRFIEGTEAVTSKFGYFLRDRSASAVASEFRVDSVGKGYDFATILMLKLIPVKQLVEEYAKTAEGAELIRRLRSGNNKSRKVSNGTTSPRSVKGRR
jgi:hypothetical protein